MMGEDIMTKETEDRMCLLKRHNDKRTEGIMTKETRDRMRLQKRHNDKRTEGIMTKETGERESWSNKGTFSQKCGY